MAKYINIEKFESASPCCPNCGNDCKHECEFFTSIFAEDIVEDVAPVIHAKWEKHSIWEKRLDGFMTCVHSVSCSNCNTHFGSESNYCPNCGAIMDQD